MKLQDLQKSLKSITSKEIETITGKRHDHILRDIRNMESDWVDLGRECFTKVYYKLKATGEQEHPMYILNTNQLSDYIDRRRNTPDLAPLIDYYNKMEGANKRSMMLVTRKELMFEDMLRTMFNNAHIQSQVPFLGKYKADFILDGDILIEYDEVHHEYKEDTDKVRQEEILDAMDEIIFKDNENSQPLDTEGCFATKGNSFLEGVLEGGKSLRSRGRYCKCVRVKEGFEIEGLREIVVILANSYRLNHNISGII